MTTEEIKRAVEISRETFGYLTMKANQLEHINGNIRKIFEDRMGALDKLITLAEAYLSARLPIECITEFRMKANKAMSDKTKDCEKQGRFNGYPKGMKHEVACHYQDGFWNGANWAFEELHQLFQDRLGK